MNDRGGRGPKCIKLHDVIYECPLRDRYNILPPVFHHILLAPLIRGIFLNDVTHLLRHRFVTEGGEAGAGVSKKSQICLPSFMDDPLQ